MPNMWGKKAKPAAPSRERAAQAVDSTNVWGDLIQAQQSTVVIHKYNITIGAASQSVPIQAGSHPHPAELKSLGTPPIEGAAFYGRAAELRSLADVAARQTDRAIVIYGPGGVGKSALAARFWRGYDSSAVRVWIDATSRSSAATSILAFAKMITGQDLEYPVARSVMRSFIGRAEDALVALDNVQDPLILDELGTAELRGAIVITSRHSLNIPGCRNHMLLQPLEASDKVSWCRNRLAGTDEAFELLSEKISGFPLITERIINLFASAGYSADQVLNVLQRDPSISDTRLFIGESVRRQFETLSRTDTTASALMLLIALSGEGPLPSTALTALMGEFTAVETLANIKLSGLMTGDAFTAITIHDEIAASLRLVTSTEATDKACEALMLLLSSMTPLDPSNPANWPALGNRSEFARRLAILSLTDTAARNLRADIVLADLDYLRYRGLVSIYSNESSSFSEIAREDQRKSAFAHRLRSLNLSDNQPEIEAALETSEAQLFTASGDLEVRHAVAQAYWKLGKYKKASALATEYEPSESWVEEIQLLDLAARIDREQGRYEPAVGYVAKARDLADSHAHHLLGPLLATEGVLLLDLGRLQEAHRLLGRALAEHTTTLGSGHPRVALVCNNLGIVKQELGCLSEAWELYDRAREINSATYGPVDERVAANMMNMANVLVDLGGHDEAIPIMEASLRIRHMTAASKRTWAVGIAYHNLAYAHFCANRNDWAEKLFHYSLYLKSKSLPEADPRRLSSWCGIVRCRIRSGRPWSYRPSIAAVLDRTYQNHPDNSVLIGLLWAALAEAFYFDDEHPAYHRCAVRADLSLGKWGGRSTDREWVRRLAA